MGDVDVYKLDAPLALSELATNINNGHARAVAQTGELSETFYEVGLWLRDAKGQVKHGEWLKWVKANLTFSDRQASSYMRAAECLSKMPASDRKHTSDLSLSEAIRTIARRLPADKPKAPKLKAPAPGTPEYERDRKECVALYQNVIDAEERDRQARATHNIPDGALFMGDYVTRIGPDGRVGWYTFCDAECADPQSVTQFTSIAEMAAAMESGIEEDKKTQRNVLKARRAYLDEIVKLDPDQWDWEVHNLIYWLARRGKRASGTPVAAEVESPLVILPPEETPASDADRMKRAMRRKRGGTAGTIKRRA